MRAEAVSILTPTEIRNIRHYVQHKYSDLPSDQRAEIVADAMQRIVLKQLPDFPEVIKNKLTAELLRDIVAVQLTPVSVAHIFEACLSLDFGKSELFQPIHAWTEQQLRTSIDTDAFRELLGDAVAGRESNNHGLQSWNRLIVQAVATGIPYDKNLITQLAPGEGSEVIKLPLAKRSFIRSAIYAILSVMLVTGTLVYGWQMLGNIVLQKPQPPIVTKPVQEIIIHDKNELPSELQYTAINEKQLVQYLQKKSSLLAEEPYLHAILNVAKEMDIHPLLLFAITGQEQAFVPKTHKLAKEIANNPFNVFHSWSEYNTTIEQSTRIAAKTINRLSKDRPNNKDAITWINREYAEDRYWSKGVTSILQAMKRYIQSDIER
ncbi:hypothetical protein Back11_12690 [Paenibacillus baekrokdamisoli]|uniref:Uncharacterized protein n=1 Tax=Paenibacillus baekrokdamisoli TaxID=1712516 RepID=A0A3G9J9F2_9BACL|nr:glucosaminidase domain-containing protein [Paenibacillus baekrokdamisoli]MBB3070573.1 hypothetical protein [Paenibacillus baekrokdamisoli]BBH19924.1 hypothetical protein Back11_12690 [Paenibacillus baekrokdamisoli]